MRYSLLCLVGAAALFGSGCAMYHSTTPGALSSVYQINPPTNAKPVAVVHAETWCPALFYYIKLGNASLDKSQERAALAATAAGADAIVYPQNHVEVHMPLPLPFILGWHEYHVWGLAVKHEN